MALCTSCQAFDIRGLLLWTLAEKAKKNHDWNAPSMGDRWYIYLGYFRYNSILSIKSSAKMHCELCILIWEQVIGSYTSGKDATDEQLQTEYGGPIYLGAGVWHGKFEAILHRELEPSTDGNRAYRMGYLEVCAVRCIGPSLSATLPPQLIVNNIAHVPSDRPEITSFLQRQIFPDSRSQACLAVAKEWLETCLHNHPDCTSGSMKEHRLPTRVIDVGTELTNPVLYITNGRIGSWAALSYTWGGNSDLILTKGSFDALRRGFPLAEYPSTLRDAIAITRSLGIQYLWIDALCILQDSSDDWASESGNMGQVYTNATVTIIAGASQSVTGGILGPRSVPTSCNLTWRVPKSETVTGNISEEKNDEIDSIDQVSLRPIVFIEEEWRNENLWASRAWTMQEYFLSTRTLFFTSEQMIWECTTTRVSESGSLRNTREEDSSTEFQSFKRLLTPTALKIPREIPWHHFVLWYSKRFLTKGTDRLPAIAGLARNFQLRTREKYCAGLWEEQLPKGLLWCYHGQINSIPDYVGPSWSWVGLDGGLGKCSIYWTSRGAPDEDITTLARIENVYLEYQSSDIYGQLKYGEMTLSAPFLCLKSLSNDSECVTQAGYAAFQRFIFQIFETKDFSTPEYQVENRHNLDITHWAGLEFFHKHQDFVGQHFAAIKILAEIWSQETKQAAVHLLILESTEDCAKTTRESDEKCLYRRVAQVSVRPLIIGTDGSENGISEIENAACLEISKDEWPSRIVTII